jgi:transcriptional regulator with PAS, ATPase and Fis domain
MLQLFDVLPQVSASPSTVLIEGPSGTGKERVARAIHNLSPRRRKPFVAVNCAALPDSLLESELFGVKAGAFREDLYDRIRVVHLTLPVLAQRREDIPLLVDHLVAKFNHRQGKAIAGVSDDVLARLMEHDYPGNVRELENIIEQAFVLYRKIRAFGIETPATDGRGCRR